ncbi:class I SAM-dependent rRNA methyltransferase [Balneolales bacterium ANBcel1]|nr:class I SAM-dependent rRNA methyltransferase [Balneolales bacterium ANBcel1]
MKQSPPAVHIAKGKEKRIRKGHLWVFSNELLQPEKSLEPGSVVRIFDAEKGFVGTGFYHPHALIAVRLLTRKDLSIDGAFFTERIRLAFALRDRVIKNTSACRMVNAEGDELPGLMIDRYDRGFVIQCVTAGMENHLDLIVDAVKQIADPDFIILKRDHPHREREGLAIEKPVFIGDDEGQAGLAADMPVMVTEGSVSFPVDLTEEGPDAFHIDQRDHRLMFGRMVSEGDRVLDIFCRNGSFAIHAARSGAAEVMAADNSDTAIALAEATIKANQLNDIISTWKGDLSKRLPQMAHSKDVYDVVNVNPPDFAPNRKSVGTALRTHRNLHKWAMDVLRPDGILATSCRSHHITDAAFMESVQRACKDSKKQVQLLHRGSHPADHPELPGMPETGYNKFYIFRVRPID